jgi:hypothetical protein
MLLSLLNFTQNLTNHILNTASLPPLLLRQKPLVQARVNALLENRHAFNTNNNIQSLKIKEILKQNFN